MPGQAHALKQATWHQPYPGPTEHETEVPTLVLSEECDIRKQELEGTDVDKEQKPIISVQFSCSVVSDSLRPHGLQHARPPCPSPTPGVHPNSSPLSWWCHPTISSSVVPFSSCPPSSPASGSFQMSQFFASGGQSIRVSASTSVLPMNT